MWQTIVPNRNLIFLSILAGVAISEECEEIWLGVHSGDHFIYPDCRPEFIHSAEETIRLATGTNLTLWTPFLHTDKLGILKKGFALTAPPPYQYTRTCYSQDEVADGVCGSCQERREAFQLLGIEDPIPYQYTGPLFAKTK
jgi:7-cyano-7-deazaguanine synthase